MMKEIDVVQDCRFTMFTKIKVQQLLLYYYNLKVCHQ
jgi:hypothetical protein